MKRILPILLAALLGMVALGTVAGCPGGENGEGANAGGNGDDE